jgi:hypothetical protein
MSVRGGARIASVAFHDSRNYILSCFAANPFSDRLRNCFERASALRYAHERLGYVSRSMQRRARHYHCAHGALTDFESA